MYISNIQQMLSFESIATSTTALLLTNSNSQILNLPQKAAKIAMHRLEPILGRSVRLELHQNRHRRMYRMHITTHAATPFLNYRLQITWSFLKLKCQLKCAGSSQWYAANDDLSSLGCCRCHLMQSTALDSIWLSQTCSKLETVSGDKFKHKKMYCQ